MNKSFGTLTAVVAVITIAGCGKQEATSEGPAASATNLSETPKDGAYDDTWVENKVVLAVAQDNAAVALTPGEEDAPVAAQREAVFDPRNSSFSLDGKTVTLRNGLSKVAAAPGSASSVTTRYLGKVAQGDLTSDGRDDAAYFVIRDDAGSGQFYYVVAAINGKNGYKTTNAFLVGDRIRPQSLRINSNELQVNFVGRGKGEPMAAPPTRESVLLMKVTPSGVLQGLMK